MNFDFEIKEMILHHSNLIQNRATIFPLVLRLIRLGRVFLLLMLSW